MARVAGPWNRLSDEEKQRYCDAADRYNEQKGTGKFKTVETAAVRSKHLAKNLSNTISQLKEECNIDAFCLLCAGSIGGLAPKTSCVASGIYLTCIQ